MGAARPSCTSGATLVQTNQSNTYTTGTQDMSSATAFKVPVASAPAPTANGSIAYGTSAAQWQAGGNGGATGSFPRLLKVITPSSDMVPCTTSFTAFATTYSIPCGFMHAAAGKGLRAEWVIYATYGSSQSVVTAEEQAGTTAVYVSGGTTATMNTVTATGSLVIDHVTSATGASDSWVSWISGMGLDTSPYPKAWLNAASQPVTVSNNPGNLSLSMKRATSGTATWQLLALRIWEIN